MQKNDLIALKNISHKYGSIFSVIDISYHFKIGSLTAIFGPNGGGKSTLLKLIAGLLSPNKGSISSTIRPSSRLGYLAQTKDIDRTFPLHVEDVVAMGLWPRLGLFKGLSVQECPSVNNALEKVGLTGFNKRSLTELSGGQLQRVFFARLIVQEADVILLDEPFTGVDNQTTKDLITLIQNWHQTGKTIIAVLHDMPLIHHYFPDCLLISKKLIASGPSAEVLTPENLAEAAFYV